MLFYHQFYIQFVNNFSFSILVLSRYLTAILSSSLQTEIFCSLQIGICHTYKLKVIFYFLFSKKYRLPMIQKQIPISIVEKVPSLIPTTNSNTPANAIIMPAIFSTLFLHIYPPSNSKFPLPHLHSHAFQNSYFL